MSRNAGPLKADHNLSIFSQSTPLSHVSGTRLLKRSTALPIGFGIPKFVLESNSQTNNIRPHLRTSGNNIQSNHNLDRLNSKGNNGPSLTDITTQGRKRIAVFPEERYIPPTKQPCLNSRTRIPTTNPHYRRRSNDSAVCSVPYLPLPKESVPISSQSTQMSLGSFFPVKKSNVILTTIETQTSPHSCDLPSKHCLKESRSSNNVFTETSNQPKKRLRRTSGSRQMLDSLCNSAKKTIKTLRRAVSSDRLTKSASNTTPVPVVPIKEKYSTRLSLVPSGSSVARIFQYSTPRHYNIKGKEKAFFNGQTESTHRSVVSLGSYKRVLLQKPSDVPFGFFVVKRGKDLLVSRIAENATHLAGLLHQDDVIVTINNLDCQNSSLEEIHKSIHGVDQLVMEIFPKSQPC